MSARRRLRPALAAVLLTGVLAVAGCSSSSDDAASTTSSATGPSASADGSTADSSVTSAESTASGSSDASASPTEAAPPSEAASSAASSEVPAPATTPVPAPGGGDINQTVPAVELTSAAPVSLTATADFGGGVTVDLASIESTQTTAQGPGEVAGPGLVITVRIKNGSAAAVPLNAVNVTVSDGAQTPASPMSGTPAAPFSGEVAPGAEAQGVYVFTLPGEYTDPATVTVSYSTDAPIVVFTGNAK
jgi:hypothetical protein